MNSVYHEFSHFMKIHPFTIFSDQIEAQVMQGDVMGKLPFEVQRMEQTHGDGIAEVSEYGDVSLGVDALVSRSADVRLLVKTADCIPLIMADEEAGVIAAVHAGWKSLVADIIPKTVARMVEMGADAGRIKVGIGPNLGACCSRFSDPSNEIPERYHWAIQWEDGVKDGTEAIVGQNFKRPGVVNLRAIRDQQLSEAGIRVENIEAMDVCTACESGWPSWRRNKTNERFGTSIMRVG